MITDSETQRLSNPHVMFYSVLRAIGLSRLGRKNPRARLCELAEFLLPVAGRSARTVMPRLRRSLHGGPSALAGVSTTLSSSAGVRGGRSQIIPQLRSRAGRAISLFLKRSDELLAHGNSLACGRPFSVFCGQNEGDTDQTLTSTKGQDSDRGCVPASTRGGMAKSSLRRGPRATA